MRGIAGVMIVVAIGIASMMLGMSGFGTAWGAPDTGGSPAAAEVNDSASEVGPQGQPISGPVSTGDSSVVGLIVSGGQAFISFLGSVAVFPIVLIDLGFPPYMAVPGGILAQLLAGISIIEWYSNRELT